VSLLNRVRSTISRSGLLLYLLPLALLGIFFFYPLIIILMTMFSRSGEIYSSGIWQPLGFTFYQALLSTFFTLVLGLPIAFVFARFDFTGKDCYARLPCFHLYYRRWLPRLLLTRF